MRIHYLFAEIRPAAVLLVKVKLVLQIETSEATLSPKQLSISLVPCWRSKARKIPDPGPVVVEIK